MKDADEAVRLANDTCYGLNASLWTTASRGEDLAVRLQAGTVNVNEGYAAAWASHDAPMGGMKESGVGRRHGREGILKYTEAQTVAVQRLLPVGADAGDTAGALRQGHDGRRKGDQEEPFRPVSGVS